MKMKLGKTIWRVRTHEHDGKHYVGTQEVRILTWDQDLVCVHAHSGFHGAILYFVPPALCFETESQANEAGFKFAKNLENEGKTVQADLKPTA